MTRVRVVSQRFPWHVFKRGSVVIFLDFLRENRPVPRPSRPVTAGPPSLRVPPPFFGFSPRGPRVRAPSAGCFSPAARYRVSLRPAPSGLPLAGASPGQGACAAVRDPVGATKALAPAGRNPVRVHRHGPLGLEPGPLGPAAQLPGVEGTSALGQPPPSRPPSPSGPRRMIPLRGGGTIPGAPWRLM